MNSGSARGRELWLEPVIKMGKTPRIGHYRIFRKVRGEGVNLPGIGIGIGLHVPTQTPPEEIEPEALAVEWIEPEIEPAPELSAIDRLRIFGRRMLSKIRKVEVKKM